MAATITELNRFVTARHHSSPLFRHIARTAEFVGFLVFLRCVRILTELKFDFSSHRRSSPPSPAGPIPGRRANESKRSPVRRRRGSGRRGVDHRSAGRFGGWAAGIAAAALSFRPRSFTSEPGDLLFAGILVLR
jgi:hypothetical protein